eukprot:CAMPEP_0175060204 /NCGR_PEP_ID=MMETSP0052_2-20121109/12869_1 /TAXON_ID=51329 ORGANISM="Polytomella parva, Strain SAG 63-3" /NCGR_SAMPLE_ID=MMETSP0052_2 /ASSEMBLY_ACC=CAM_ASM_000194 /LENGTH=263 /DNA_ID=CAMNT_0016325861 /DNA_START=187 /DNA_END=978 /DNA_ORIENTATION=+
MYDTDGSLISSENGNFPSALLANPQLLTAQRIEVRLSTFLGEEKIRPQQLQLIAESRASGLSAFAQISKRDAVFNGPITLSMDAALIKKFTGEQAGLFELYLLAADSSASQGLRWNLGAFELVAPSAAVASSSPLFKSATSQELSLSQKPEIRHIFRAAARRPPAAVSVFFSALVLIPLVAVLAYVFGPLGVNAKGFPTAFAPKMAAVAFHISLLAMVGVLAAFWIKWNLLQTIPVAMAAGAAIFVSGYFSLGYLASHSEKQD